jgi:hypothetical protein
VRRGRRYVPALRGYFLLSGLVWLPRDRRERHWLLAVALPCFVLPLLLAALGSHVRTATLVWLLVVLVLWPTFYERQRSKAAQAGTG